MNYQDKNELAKAANILIAANDPMFSYTFTKNQDQIENSFKIMDLSNPMISKEEKLYLDEVINEDIPDLNSKLFISLYNEDKMGGMIRNLDIWLKENFEHFKGYIV